MKEINFIPDWYTRGKIRQRSYRRQYIVLSCVFAVLVLWSFVSGRSVSKAQARIDRMRDSLSAGTPAAAEYAQIENTIGQLQQKVDILEKLDTKVNIPNILAELSFLINDNIILGKFDFQAEPFEASNKQTNTSNVRLGYRSNNAKTTLLQKPSCFRIVIRGIAANASDVAELISKLEYSPYFCLVVPGVMENTDVKGHIATKFEINCYLANYIQTNQEASK